MSGLAIEFNVLLIAWHLYSKPLTFTCFLFSISHTFDFTTSSCFMVGVFFFIDLVTNSRKFQQKYQSDFFRKRDFSRFFEWRIFSWNREKENATTTKTMKLLDIFGSSLFLKRHKLNIFVKDILRFAGWLNFWDFNYCFKVLFEHNPLVMSRFWPFVVVE